MAKHNNIKNSINTRIIITSIALVLSMVLCITVSFAWFNNNKSTDVNGINFGTNNVSVHFGGYITVVRTLNTRSINILYKKDSDGNYYEYENGEYVLQNENKKPISVSGLLPTESMDFSITLESDYNLDNYTYEIGFRGLSGKDIVINDITYSILGLYRINELNGEEIGEAKWLATFTPPVVNSKVVIKNSFWHDDKDVENTVTINFRITLDLTNFNALSITNTQNLLSEAQINISDLYANIEEI